MLRFLADIFFGGHPPAPCGTVSANAHGRKDFRCGFGAPRSGGIRPGANGGSRYMRPEGYGGDAGVRLKFLWGGMMPARSDYIPMLVAAGIASMGLASGFEAEYMRAGITGLMLGLGVWGRSCWRPTARRPDVGPARRGPRARSGGPRVRARHGRHGIDNAVRRFARAWRWPCTRGMRRPE